MAERVKWRSRRTADVAGSTTEASPPDFVPLHPLSAGPDGHALSQGSLQTQTLQLQRLAGNQAVAAFLKGFPVGRVRMGVWSTPVGIPIIQRLVAKDDLWDHYFTAYDSRMKKKHVYEVDRHWTDLFFNFERQLYGAKTAAQGPQGNTAYDNPAVQDAHDNLVPLGFIAPAPADDPNVTAARALLTHANSRWAAFRGNHQLNRGAWAQSAAHGGQPATYVQTAAPVIAVLTGMQVAQGGRLGRWWLMNSDTAPSGHALHRGGFDARGDFIYHL